MFYNDINTAMSKVPTYFSIMVGDFNAKLGKKQDESEFSLGQHGIGKRNNRGNTLLQFLLEHNLHAMNTFFKKAKHRRWTWISSDGNTKNEIDFIITDRKRLVQDVTVLNRVSVGSDHRMVRATIMVNLRRERKTLTKASNKKWTAVTNHDEYQRTITEHLGNTDKMNIETLNSTIIDSIQEAQRKHCSKVNNKEEKLLTNTRHLMRQRREMLQENPRNKDQLRQVNKDISKAV